MRVMAFIDKMDVISKILKHLGLWDDKPKPKANPPPAAEFEFIIEDAVPQPMTLPWIRSFRKRPVFKTAATIDNVGLCFKRDAASQFPGILDLTSLSMAG
jgi:hypothetical protein